MDRRTLQALHRLARLYGVQVRYRDGFGEMRESPPETLLAVLAELGAPVAGAKDIVRAASDRRRAIWEQLIEPVVVVWRGRDRRAHVPLRVPASAETATLSVLLQFEDGREPFCCRHNDWEFVQYLSDIVAERNDYELLDEG